MLRRLRIESFVLIREADLAFAPGLNAVTGETGAGKTILAQAVGLLLGAPGDAAYLGPGAEEAYVEAELDLPEAILDEPGLEAIAELRPESEKAVKRALLLEAIAERESINPAEDEVDKEIERFAQATQRPAQAVRRMMEKSGDLESLRRGLREKKALDFLIEHAKVSA